LVRRGQAGLGFEARAFARREGPRGGDAPGGEEVRSRKARLGRRHEQARAGLPQPLEAMEETRHLFEGRDSVAQASRILIAAALGQITKTRTQTWECEVRLVELFLRGAVQRTARQPGARAAAEWPERGRRLRADKLVAAPPQIDVAVGPRAARVRRRT